MGKKKKHASALFLEVQIMDEMRLDKSRLAVLCRLYQQGVFAQREHFTRAVIEIVDCWNGVVQSQLYWQVEATVRSHFCEFWEDCQAFCFVSARPGHYLKERACFTRLESAFQVREGQRQPLAPGIRYTVLHRDDFRCQICGRTAKDGVKLEVDHIMPYSKGGSDELSNLWTLCFDCNRGKQDAHL